MLATIEGPRTKSADEEDGPIGGTRVDKLSDEQAEAMIYRFRDWPDKERYILL